MRELNVPEIFGVCGGVNQPVCFEHSYYREFWDAYVQSAGAGAGYLSSPLLALGMLVYAIGYYGIYTPIYYAVSGVGYVVGGAFNLAASGVSSAYHAIAG